MKIPAAAAIDREIGLRGRYYDFVKMAWQVIEPEQPFVPNWHIDAICDHLEAVFRGHIKRLVINVPPGSGKSVLTSVLWPVWTWIQNPGWRFIYGSFDESLVARRDGTKVLDVIRSAWFRERWGDKVLIKGKEPSLGEFYTTRGGMRFATSVGGKVLGRHAHAIVVDDPTKPQTMTEASLQETRRWKQETTASRLLPGGAYVLIMQRLHSNDLAGMAEEENEIAGGEPYEFLRLPMRFEEAQRAKTSIGFVDPRTEEGELLWPSYKNEKEVSQQEKDMGGRESAVVAAQLQQRPAPAKGLLFERDWFQHWDSLPEKFDFVVDSWDLTFKDTEKSDYVVGQRWARAGAKFFLLARVRGRWNFPKTLSEMKSFYQRVDLPKPQAVLVEDKANGPAIIATLGKELPGFIAVNPEGGKIVRAQAVTPLYEARNVLHPNPAIVGLGGVRPYVWVEEHEAELMRFPKGRNDDSVDATTQALNYLRNKASAFQAAMDALAQNGLQTVFRGIV